MLLLVLLRAARAAAAQRFQFSFGRGSRAASSSGAGTVRDVVDDGPLHRGRCAGVGSFSYAHGKHHECASGIVSREMRATVISIIQSE